MFAEGVPILPAGNKSSLKKLNLDNWLISGPSSVVSQTWSSTSIKQFTLTPGLNILSITLYIFRMEFYSLFDS